MKYIEIYSRDIDIQGYENKHHITVTPTMDYIALLTIQEGKNMADATEKASIAHYFLRIDDTGELQLEKESRT